MMLAKWPDKSELIVSSECDLINWIFLSTFIPDTKNEPNINTNENQLTQLQIKEGQQ